MFIVQPQILKPDCTTTHLNNYNANDFLPLNVTVIDPGAVSIGHEQLNGETVEVWRHLKNSDDQKWYVTKDLELMRWE